MFLILYFYIFYILFVFQKPVVQYALCFLFLFLAFAFFSFAIILSIIVFLISFEIR